MFEYSFLAWLFLIIPVLLMIQFFRYKDRSKLWTHFQHPRNWKSDIQLSDSGHYFWQKIFISLALVACIFALMKPQFGERYETIERSGRQIYFVVDTSLSMLAEDGLPTRLDTAKYHMQQLLSKLSNDSISIIPYASTAYVYLPLTNDLSATNLFIEDMFVGMIGSSGSNITNALDIVAKNMATQGSKSATIIVFSDGEFSPALSSQKLKQMLGKRNIDSIIVGIGSRQGEPIPQKSADDKLVSYKKDSAGNIVLTKRVDANLQRLSKLINGTVFDGDPSPLVTERIYLHLSKIETQALEEQQRVTKIDRYHWVLLLALIILLIEYFFPKLTLKYMTKTFIFIVLLGAFSNPIYSAHPGNNAYYNQDYELAKKTFEKDLVKDPENAKIIYNLGNTYYKMQEYDQAIQAYKESLPELNKFNQTKALYNIGTSYLKNNDLKSALSYYKEVLKRDPNHLKTKQNIELALRQDKSNQQSSSDQEQDTSSNEDNSESDPNNQTEKLQPENNNSSAENDLEDTSTPDNKEELTEQQIQYLVDNAEKEAREKRHKKMDQLFEENTW
jgi:Ca-activated chloride channel family protein